MNINFSRIKERLEGYASSIQIQNPSFKKQFDIDQIQTDVLYFLNDTLQKKVISGFNIQWLFKDVMEIDIRDPNESFTFLLNFQHLNDKHTPQPIKNYDRAMRGL